MQGSREALTRFEYQHRNSQASKKLNDEIIDIYSNLSKGLHEAHFCRTCVQAKLISQIIAFIWRWVDYNPDDDQDLHKKKAAKMLKQIFDDPFAKNRMKRNDYLDLNQSNSNEYKTKIQLEQLLHKYPFEYGDKVTGQSIKEEDVKNKLVSIDKENGTDSKVNIDKILPEDLLYLVFEFYTTSEKTKHRLHDIFPILKDEEKEYYYVFVDCERFHGELKDPTANNPKKMTLSIPYPPRPRLGEATLTKEKDLKTWLEDTDLSNVIADNPYIPTTCC